MSIAKAQSVAKLPKNAAVCLSGLATQDLLSAEQMFFASAAIPVEPAAQTSSMSTLGA
ncbi:hypothetical protein Pr1d_49240 [Bythopirellula goksoeyrii]|uniref:Uncharacterized protein n=1 Tax=Bythopirellula goksoeyrii TaxID=1400387 RepID=A0A5B9QEY5_9BACT|nr:hypothetical protein Pr1d_49240 [Bythopirellula goksoeyrii]